MATRQQEHVRRGENPYSTILEYDLAAKSLSIIPSTPPDYVIDLSFSRDALRDVRPPRLSTDAGLLTARSTSD